MFEMIVAYNIRFVVILQIICQSEKVSYFSNVNAITFMTTRQCNGLGKNYIQPYDEGAFKVNIGTNIHVVGDG